MSVEDHPKYSEWLAANARLVATFEQLQKAIREGEPWHMIRGARGAHQLAQANYDSIADELDDAQRSGIE